MVMDGSSVITTPGTQTQYTFNVDISQSDITVRADTCNNTLTGENATNTVNLRVCDPNDLRISNVGWSETPMFQGGLGIYSFSGGNVTFDGVSLGSTATYTTNERYLVNGSQTFTSRCGNDNWVLPSQGIVAGNFVCRMIYCHVTIQLLPLLDNMLCCNRNSLCSTYTGLANGSTATYTTSQEYCIVSDSPLPVVRTCVDMSWSGEIPTIMEASQPGKLSTSNVAMIVIGLLFFIAGVGISVVVVILLSQRTTKGTAWCFPTLFLVIVIPVLETVLWLAFLGYVVANDFSEDDGYVRGDDSLCRSPSGTVGVRDGLLIASFVLSLLVLSGWLVCLTTVKCANPPSSQGQSDITVRADTCDGSLTGEIAMNTANLRVCDPNDLLVPGVNWTPEANFTNGVGNYSFSGGNVTFDGVSLGSIATYTTTNAHYHINGSDTRRCLNNVCLAGDLLSCNNPAFPANNTICCNGDTLCSTYTGLANGSTANYTTSQDYCILSDSPVLRSCVNMSWSGETPTEAKASQPGKLSTSNVAMIVIGLLFFIAGVGISVVVVILLSQRTTKDFSEDDGYVRGDDSLCQTPSGTVSVRDGLLIASFVLSLLVLSGWLVCPITVKESRKQRKRLMCCRKQNNQEGQSTVTVVIEDGVGSRVRERVGAVNCSSIRCSHTYYPAASSRGEFGVSVETAGCVTRQTVCLERPVYCSLRDLSPSLVEENRVCGSVSGGGVCYSGDSVGSVAVYFCDDGYSLEGDTTRECLSSGLWNGTTPQCVEIINGCITPQK
ncbi:hypothetical protein GBAR_LOCUS10717 [Geodia barretti]|uniref:Sushi domain-containing protein n=1 Tax=Geodia barretti TaxID=519541 RepID=A0AA35WDU5_GEOBA|nr:hypothetical protein GBAR_LOCUS10717 [Geodia barretti]